MKRTVVLMLMEVCPEVLYDGMKKAVCLGLFKQPQAAHAGQEHTTMTENATSAFPFSATSGRDELSELLREGAQRLLGHAIEAEVARRGSTNEPISSTIMAIDTSSATATPQRD